MIDKVSIFFHIRKIFD